MTDFWIKKMKTYFKRIDVDGDGCITRKDFEQMAQRFSTTGTTGVDVLTKRLISIYDDCLGQVTCGKPVNEGEFLEVVKKNKDIMDKFTGTLKLFFKAVDTDGDGQISLAEFEQFFLIIGVKQGLAEGAFNAIDTNKDGQLSEDEFVHAGTDFFTNQNDSEFKNFLGPLVD